MSTIAHPSPRGDKLCLETEAFVAFRRSFRPLAGISCVADAEIIKGELRAFPSPRGDKLCPSLDIGKYADDLCPSPRGDKLGL